MTFKLMLKLQQELSSGVNSIYIKVKGARVKVTKKFVIDWTQKIDC